MAAVNEIYVAKKIDKNETVSDLIKKYKGFLADCFDLIKDGVIIPQNKLLRELKIDGYTELRFKERQVKFIVRQSNGLSLPVEYGLCKTIKSLKDYLHDVKKVTVDQQRMTVDGQSLNDEWTLNECKIGNDSVLQMNPVHSSYILSVDTNNINIKLKDTTTVSEFIMIRKGLDADDYDLAVNGKVVPRNITLRDANVSINSKLEIQERKISFTVRLCDGKRIRVNFSPTKTILNLKDHLHDVEKVPVCQQRLSFNGQDLSDNFTLRKCGIKDDSDIYLLGRLYGG